MRRVLFGAAAFCLGWAPAGAQGPLHSSSIYLDSRSGKVWAVNPDHASVISLDAGTLLRSPEYEVGKTPSTLGVDAQGMVWVVNQGDASLSVLDPRTGRTMASVPLPFASRPYGIAMDPGGRTAYVTLQATGQIAKIDLENRSILSLLDVCPTPRALAVTSDGARILVARFLSPKDSAEVVEVSASPFRKTRTFSLAHDPGPDDLTRGHGVPNGLSAIMISPDGNRAWIASKKDNTRRGVFADSLAHRPLTFESTVRNILSQIDLANGREDLSARLDLDNSSQAAALAFSSRYRYVYVANQGSNQVSVFPIYDHVPTTATGEHLEIAGGADASQLAPQGLALDDRDSLLFVHYFTSREIGVYDVSDVGIKDSIRKVALVKTVDRETLPSDVLRGKQIFYNTADPRMSKDKYLSCFSCHMDGGGQDGRVWDFTDRGEGLRNTTSLIGTAGMGNGPLHWSANFDEIQDFEHDIRGPFQGRGFLPDGLFNQGTRNTSLGDPKAGLSVELDALAAYVGSLNVRHPSPYRKSRESMTEAALAGREVFFREETGCAQCHLPPRYTNSDVNTRPFRLYDVGTIKPGSGNRLGSRLPGFDVPSLVGVWETPPYLHDGSAATLMDVLTTANPLDRHGKTSQLSTGERRNLEAFLLQLDGSDDPVPIRDFPERSAAQEFRISVGYADGAGSMQIKITRPANARIGEIAVVNLRGKVLHRFNGNGNQSGIFHWIPPSDLSRGIYAILAKFGNRKISRSFVLSR